MAKVRVGGFSSAPILRWAEVEPGTVFEVKFHGIRQGQYTPLADVTVLKGGPPTGELTMPCATALETRLSRIRAGALVTIAYRGMAKTKGGKECHTFEVDADEGDVAPAPARKDGDEERF